MTRPRSDSHETFTRPAEAVKGSSDRTFGLVFSAVFLLVGLWPAVHGRFPRWWALGVAAAFLVTTLVWPRALTPLNRLWTRLGLLLHRVTSPVILGLLFYGTVTPMGLLLRLLGKDLLRLRFDPDAASYWIERRPPGPAPDTMPHQF
jgi:hypothetical protein